MERYKTRIGKRFKSKVDMQFIPYTMNALVKSTNLRAEKWITSNKIKNSTRHIEQNWDKIKRRITILTKRGFLKKKKMSKKQKLKLYGTTNGHYNIYGLGKKSKNYLKDYENFLNPNAPLMKKRKKIKIIEKEVQVEKEVEVIKKNQDKFLGEV